MPLNIKSDHAHGMAKELARLTGQSITAVVTQALQDALVTTRARQEHHRERVIRELGDIAHHCAALSVLDDRHADQILGYDENGMPGG